MRGCDGARVCDGVNLSSMPTPEEAPATMTKREVCAHLGKSKRTVETYISDGRLPCEYVNGPNGKQLSFRAEDVERMKRDIDMPIARTPPVCTDTATPVPSTALAYRADSDPFAGLAAHLARLGAAFPSKPPALKPYVTLAEAVEYSGLPAAFLISQAREGSIDAVNVGKGKKEFWRFAKP